MLLCSWLQARMEVRNLTTQMIIPVTLITNRTKAVRKMMMTIKGKWTYNRRLSMLTMSKMGLLQLELIWKGNTAMWREGRKTKCENALTVVQRLRAENGLQPAIIVTALYTTLLAKGRMMKGSWKMRQEVKKTSNSIIITSIRSVRCQTFYRRK